MTQQRHSQDYVAYLRSAEWQAKRLDVLEAAGSRCERCGVLTGRLEVHHLTYDRLGDEWPEDLRAVCPACHEVEDSERAWRTEQRRIAREAYRHDLERWARDTFGPEWRAMNGRGYVERDFAFHLASFSLDDAQDPGPRSWRCPRGLEPRERSRIALRSSSRSELRRVLSAFLESRGRCLPEEIVS